MSIYAIGDIQGCFDYFIKLLDKINFDKNNDKLWLVGDVINRGPESAKMLDWLYKNQDSIQIVLGNHDLHLIAVYYKVRELQKLDTIDDILKHNDCEKWINWLKEQPLIHYDNQLNYLMVHAGIPPKFDLQEALDHAEDLSKKLSGKTFKTKQDYTQFLKNLFGNNPNNWEDAKNNEIDKDRYLINAFTRMRHCKETGELDLKYKGPDLTQDNNFKAWFLWKNRENKKIKDKKIIFGHWAALSSKHEINVMPNIFALDTGCVWGNKLTAMRLEDNSIFSLDC